MVLLGTVQPEEGESLGPSQHLAKLCQPLEGAVAEAGEEVLHLQLICRLWELQQLLEKVVEEEVWECLLP